MWGNTTGMHAGVREGTWATLMGVSLAHAATPHPHVSWLRGFACRWQRRVRAHEWRLQSSVVLSILHLLRFCFLSLVYAVVSLTEKDRTNATLEDDRPGAPRFHV